MALSDFKLINASSITDLSNLTSGVSANTMAKAADVNAIFRQNSLISVGLLSGLNELGQETTLTPDSSTLDDAKTYFKNSLKLGSTVDGDNNLKISLGEGSGNLVSISLDSLSVGVASKLGTSTLGTNIRPFYLNNGTPTLCNTYAGGTLVTLNGYNEGGHDISIYAPITSGSEGNLLISKGTDEDPVWTSDADYRNLPKTVNMAYNLVVNINGSQFGGDNSQYNFAFLSATPYYVMQFKYGNTVVSDLTVIKNYLKHMTGNDYIPMYDEDEPQTCFIICNSNNTVWKLQYDATNKLCAYRADNFPLEFAADLLWENTSGINISIDPSTATTKGTGSIPLNKSLDNYKQIIIEYIFTTLDERYGTSQAGKARINVHYCKLDNEQGGCGFTELEGFNFGSTASSLFSRTITVTNNTTLYVENCKKFRIDSSFIGADTDDNHYLIPVRIYGKW